MTNDLAYLRMAAMTAARDSDDPRTQNGAVLVPDGGNPVAAANHVPIGLAASPGRLVGDEKYRFVEHAERSVIHAAARHGVKTEGATLYCLWFACPDCARAIIAAGVREVVGHVLPRSRTPDRWLEAVVAGEAMLREANVSMRWLSGRLSTTIRFNGEDLEC